MWPGKPQVGGLTGRSGAAFNDVRLFHTVAATNFIPLAWLILHCDTLEPCSPVHQVSKQRTTCVFADGWGGGTAKECVPGSLWRPVSTNVSN